MPADPKDVLHRYLTDARDVLLWKLDGLSEYDVRRPLVPTGTNLLGLLKHTASCTAGYFGTVFDRAFPDEQSWFSDEHNADMWATADETREQIVELYRLAWAQADATIEALPLDAVGRVPHWPEERADVTLHQIMVHMLAETNR
ncbi:MAG: DinB family protein, partial [Actinomycetes bacterium]